MLEDTTTKLSIALAANVARLAVNTDLCFEKWRSDSLEVDGMQYIARETPANTGSTSQFSPPPLQGIEIGLD